MRRVVGLGAALVAAGAMLLVPSAVRRTATPPVNARVAWPSAQRGVLPAALSDGARYDPAVFLDVRESVGTASTTDGRSLRLLLRRANGSVRLLRTLPAAGDPAFTSAAIAGHILVWAETTRDSGELWTIDLSTPGTPRRLTADLGDARFSQSQYDLVVAGGRVYWVAAGADDTTQVRSVLLTGGRADVRTEPGRWALTAWPWLTGGGTGRLRNLVTGQDRVVASNGRGRTACSPLWCRVVSLGNDGSSQIHLMRPDGSDRRQIAAGTASNVITDIAVLDRFEVFSQRNGNSDLTGHIQLLIYEIATRTIVEVSPDATDVAYRAGVLWWSAGSQEALIRHTLDLRTL